MIVLITVFGASRLINLDQRLTDTVNGHKIEVRVGDGFARLTIDGQIADEINFLWKIISSTMKGMAGDTLVEVNLREDFSRYRVTTLIDGVKNENLSN